MESGSVTSQKTTTRRTPSSERDLPFIIISSTFVVVAVVTIVILIYLLMKSTKNRRMKYLERKRDTIENEYITTRDVARELNISNSTLTSSIVDIATVSAAVSADDVNQMETVTSSTSIALLPIPTTMTSQISSNIISADVYEMALDYSTEPPGPYTSQSTSPGRSQSTGDLNLPTQSDFHSLVTSQSHDLMFVTTRTPKTNESCDVTVGDEAPEPIYLSIDEIADMT